jgi:hypothetical protein
MLEARSRVNVGQARLVACHVVAMQLHQQSADRAPEGEALWVFVSQVKDTLTDTIRVLATIADEAEPELLEIDPDKTQEITPLENRPAVAADLAFIAGFQLRQKLDQLAQLDRRATPRALRDAAASGIRNVIKAAVAVEPVFARQHQLAPRLDPKINLKASLAVRRAYSAFRLAVQALPTATSDARALRGTLTAARAAIGELARSPSARDLRQCDRSDLLALDARLDGAIAASADRETSQQILSDVTTFADMLAAVGRRQELLAHDLAALPEMIAELRGLLAQGRPVLRGHVERARGIDDILERLLAPGLVLDGQRLLDELERILGERMRVAGGTDVAEQQVA